MADIKVQHTEETPARRRPLGAAAAVAVIVIALLVWVLFAAFNRGTEPAPNPAPSDTATDGRAAADLSARVREFEGFLRDNPAREKMGLGHDYASDGIRHLAAAVGALANQAGSKDEGTERQLAALRQYADHLQEDQHSTEHADLIRGAFILAADVMAAIQQKHHRGLSDGVAQVRRAAEAINPDLVTLKQKAEVEEYFKRASEVLRAMAG